VLIAKSNYNDQVEQGQTGGIYGTNGAKRNAYRLLVGKSEGKSHKEDKDVGGCIVLRRILERLDGVMWTASVWLRMLKDGTVL
jgi:hypothetical protein